MRKFSLRTRLLGSYVLLLVIALGTMAGALFLLLSTRPAPPQPTYRQIAQVVQHNLAEALQPLGSDPTLRQITSELTDFGSTYSVRVLVANVTTGAVFFDSEGALKTGDRLPVQLEPTYSIASFQQAAQALMRRIQTVYGSFEDPPGKEWLFAGLVNLRPGAEGLGLLFADPRPTQTFQQTLADFGPSLLVPLLQAAAIGVVIAAGLALLVSRSIARPLQAVGSAATAVAEGHFDQYIAPSGPPEVRAVAEAFNRMSGEVRASQEAQRDFMANVSHDLKTPLTSIQGYSQAIMDGAAQDPVQAAGIIYDEAGRLNRMVVELTDLARIQAGRLSMQTGAVDVGQIAAGVARRLEVVARNKGVALHNEAASLPDIAGDGDRLAQVMINLVSNAINYTPPGGHVWVRTQVNNSGVEVMVQDTGIGIAPDELARIFERFYQVDKARGPRRGTGLGLAITAEIVRAHGGKITVRSAGEGRGATFIVWLPSPDLTTVARQRW